MNTPAHLIVGLAAFGKPSHGAVTAAALGGSLLPDLSLYVLAGGALALGATPEHVFRTLYFSPEWQAVFRVDNSFLVWGTLLAAGLWRGWAWLVAGAGAGLLHLASDLPLHHDDGRAHFWPLTDWVFASPVSYWDPAHGGLWVGAAETLAVLGLALWSWRRFRGLPVRLTLVALVAAQLSVGGVWALMFA